MMGGRWRGSVKFEESHDSSGRENHPSHPKSHLKHVLQNEGGIIWNHLKAFRFCQFLACFSSPNCVQCISMLSSLGDNPPGSFWATEKKKTRRVASCKRSQPVFAASNCSSSRSPGGAPSGVDRWTTKERGGTIFLRRFLEIGSDMIWIDDRQSRMDEKEGVRFWKAGMRPFTLHIPAPKGPRDATTLAKPFSSVRLSAGRSPGSFVFSRGHGALCSK